MDMHEWPYFVKNNMYGYELEPHLKANMLLSDEPGIYIKGEFGIRLEDDLLITESGSELLTPAKPVLEDPFGNMCTRVPALARPVRGVGDQRLFPCSIRPRFTSITRDWVDGAAEDISRRGRGRRSWLVCSPGIG
jgi:hypothetical protein